MDRILHSIWILGKLELEDSTGVDSGRYFSDLRMEN
jgi:hypothetical protein